MKQYSLSVRLLSLENFELVKSNKLVSRIYIEADEFISHRNEKLDFDGEIYISFPDVFTCNSFWHSPELPRARRRKP